jgi:lipopolysaccharide cholinephosphotransferase
MSELLRNVQLTELDILKDLDRVCKANGITYFIAQGTLLGAAKYKGFIPWDDDIDVIIPYKDLVKLLEVYPAEGNDEYMITNHNIEKHFPLRRRRHPPFQ